jgi:hypothetical protein
MVKYCLLLSLTKKGPTVYKDVQSDSVPREGEFISWERHEEDHFYNGDYQVKDVMYRFGKEKEGNLEAYVDIQVHCVKR